MRRRPWPSGSEAIEKNARVLPALDQASSKLQDRSRRTQRPVRATKEGREPLMPVNPADRPVPAWMLRRRGMRRLTAVTAGVGVAGVLATGVIAVALPGSTHNATSATGTTSSGNPTTSHATSGSSSVATSSTSSSSGTKSTVSTATTSGSSNRTDATSGGS